MRITNTALVILVIVSLLGSEKFDVKPTSLMNRALSSLVRMKVSLWNWSVGAHRAMLARCKGMINALKMLINRMRFASDFVSKNVQRTTAVVAWPISVWRNSVNKLSLVVLPNRGNPTQRRTPLSCWSMLGKRLALLVGWQCSQIGWLLPPS